MADPVIPEKYELKLSEASPLDQTDVTRVETYAKANKLTQEQAAAVLKEHEGTATALLTRRQPVVPDKYELKTVETSGLDASDVDKIAAFAKANRLTQVQAAAFLKEHEATAAALMARQQTFIASERTKWQETVRICISKARERHRLWGPSRVGALRQRHR